MQDVIAALESKSAHVPFRHSVLTQLLQPTLCGSASTVTIILNVTPNGDSIGETIQTLSLGMRLKTVELGTQFKNSLKDGNQ